MQVAGRERLMIDHDGVKRVAADNSFCSKPPRGNVSSSVETFKKRNCLFCLASKTKEASKERSDLPTCTRRQRP
jgi:hypothetical protein